MIRTKIVSLPALLAVAAMPLAPLDAMPVAGPGPIAGSVSAAAPVWTPDREIAYTHRHYRHHRYRRDRVDAGDVLGGLLILGTIAAVASAASKNARRDRDYRYPARYPGNPPGNGYSPDGASGLDRAASMCVREIERDARVGEVDGVDRDAGGWRVTGSLYNGEGFTCRIGPDGRIQGVDYSTGDPRRSADAGDGPDVEDVQYDDARYRSAWADLDTQPAARSQSSSLPAYPGGPVEGDLESDEIGTDYPASEY